MQDSGPRGPEFDTPAVIQCFFVKLPHQQRQGSLSHDECPQMARWCQVSTNVLYCPTFCIQSEYINNTDTESDSFSHLADSPIYIVSHVIFLLISLNTRRQSVNLLLQFSPPACFARFFPLWPYVTQCIQQQQEHKTHFTVKHQNIACNTIHFTLLAKSFKTKTLNNWNTSISETLLPQPTTPIIPCIHPTMNRKDLSLSSA